MTHKLFHDPYENQYLGIPKAEYDQAFHDGVNLGYIVENMSEDKIPTPSAGRLIALLNPSVRFSCPLS